MQPCTRCDGRKHCPNGKDEEGCCSKDQFTCTTNVETNGTDFVEQECIPLTKWCDGNNDCSDKSDEKSCVPGIQTLNTSNSISYKCALYNGMKFFFFFFMFPLKRIRLLVMSETCCTS